MKIAINGFGRIGRIFFRQVFNHPNFEIAAINDLSDINNLAYLLKYDSVYGKFGKELKINNEEVKIGGIESSGNFVIDNNSVLVFSEKDPEKLPWKDLGIDVVIEATGIFANSEGANKHIAAGAKKVLITAPTKDATPLFTPGLKFTLPGYVNISSNASCTTNAVNPVIYIMMKSVGVKKAFLNTIHAYTATQAIVDEISKSSDYRRGRAGAQNIIPAATGAAEATFKVIPEMKGKFDGIAIRVPIISGSLADITFVSERATSAEEINEILREAANQLQWQRILKVVDEQVVSSDILGEPYGAIVDLTLTKVVDGDLVKVFSWYDNEWGYAAMLIKHLEEINV